jgi:hypothetical protein
MSLPIIPLVAFKTKNATFVWWVAGVSISEFFSNFVILKQIWIFPPKDQKI